MAQVCLEGRVVHRDEDLSALRGTRRDGHYLIRPTAFESLYKADRDVRERQQLEPHIRRIQRLETAGLIAGQTAHDVRNLSGVLIGFAELIKETLPDGHEAGAFCDAMKRAAQRIVDINTDMLTLSSGDLLDRQPTDVNQLAEQALDLLADAPPTLTARLVLAPDIPPVNGSSAQLWRVLSNLVINARDAMQDSGVLTIETGTTCVDHPIGRCRAIEAGEYVRLTVSDTGCGIPPEIKDTIFDAFFTTKETTSRHGTGLGLSVVQAIVEDHKGYVDLESEVGIGTTFSVYLPAYRGPEAASPHHGNAEASHE